MMVGLDIVENGVTKRHAPAAAKYIREGLKARRVLVSTDGPHNSIIKIKPPLCFGKPEADRLVRELRTVSPLAPLDLHKLHFIEEHGEGEVGGGEGGQHGPLLILVKIHANFRI